MDRPRTRPFKIGLTMPPFEDREHGTHRWSTMLAVAQRAEALGFDSLWFPDHLLFRHPGKPQQGAWDSWSILTAIAAATSKVEIGPFVYCTAWRNPALIAKMADTVDEISGGRLVLALGAGWHEPEFNAFGYPFDHRFARFQEALTIIHGLLRNGQIDFEGVYYQARDCELRPRGPRPEGPPIMIGSTGEKMMRLMAQYAEMWNIDWRNLPSDIPPHRARVDEACRDVGRDPATLIRTAGIQVDLSGFPPRTGGSPPVTGSPEEIADVLRAHNREGITHIQIWLNDATVAGVEAFAPVLEVLDRG